MVVADGDLLNETLALKLPSVRCTRHLAGICKDCQQLVIVARFQRRDGQARRQVRSARKGSSARLSGSVQEVLPRFGTARHLVYMWARALWGTGLFGSVSMDYVYLEFPLHPQLHDPCAPIRDFMGCARALPSPSLTARQTLRLCCAFDFDPTPGVELPANNVDAQGATPARHGEPPTGRVRANGHVGPPLRQAVGEDVPRVRQ